MREILFRGKEENTGEWVYGYYTLYPKCCGLHPCILIGTESGCVIPKFIDLDTLGIYTNMLDKNGKKIFEGDIIDFSDRSDDDGYGVVQYDAEETKFGFVYDNYCEGLGQRYWSTNVEVIGNIYDNPELLGDEGNDSNDA